MAWRIILLISSNILLYGCYTEKQAIRQVTKAQAAYPAVMAKSCAAWYPVKTFESIKTEYKLGETVYKFDTVTVDCDSAVTTSTVIQEHKVKVPCPPGANRVDTIYKDRVKTVENTAHVTSLQAEYDGLHTKYGKLLLSLKIACIGLAFCGGIIIFLVYLIRRK